MRGAADPRAQARNAASARIGRWCYPFMSVVLVTGCSSGFGEAIALAFAERGDTVVATMRNPDGAPTTLKGRKNVDVAPLDVTDDASRRAAVDEVIRHHGRIDTLVNNAGIVASASIEDTPEELSRRIFETNYFGPVALIRAVLPILRGQGGGRIVNVTAIGAILCTPLLGVYCASKHALDCVSAVLDLEGRPFGIRVSSVLPGQFKTPLLVKATEIVTERYRGIHDTLQAARAAQAADVLTDLGPVTDAVLAAATDPIPKPRYLAGIGLALTVEPSMAELDRLHALSAQRCGVAQTSEGSDT